MNRVLLTSLGLWVAVSGLAAPGAHAEGANKCKVGLIAKLPVVMENTRASVPVTVNGKDTRVWLDSGAFFNFMPKARAVELGLRTEPLPMGFYMTGIGGTVTPELAQVRDFGIVGVTLHNVQFLVGGSDAGNGFLGANLLGVQTTEFDLAKGVVNLFQERGCDGISLAYWGKGMSVGEARVFRPTDEHDYHIIVEVMINGQSMHALLDTGAPTTLLGRRAAERAGIDMSAPDVVNSMRMGGIGMKRRESWIVRTKTISIGGEEIRNSPIRVIDDADDDRSSDMILGVDFLLSHHIIVSRAQRLMFLTYNGGPIFSATTDGEIGRLATRAENMGKAETTADPKTADEFAGRASGRMDRGDTAGAVADFSEALRLAPTRADLLEHRANAYLRSGKLDLARQDLDAGLAIRPTDHRLLTRRAQLRLATGDRASARADTDAAAAHLPPGSLDVMQVVNLYERLGAADRGLALIDAVVALHRDDSVYPSLLNARSWNRALANADLDRALKDSDLAIKKAGPQPAMLDTRALVQYRRKAYAAAIADETTALASNPRLAAALFVRGLARDASGDATGGAADLAAARAIAPRIDRRYRAYGLIAPPAPHAAPAKPPAGDADEAEDEDE